MKQVKLKKWIGIILLNSIMGMDDSFSNNDQYEDDNEGLKKSGPIPTKKSLHLPSEDKKTNKNLQDCNGGIDSETFDCILKTDNYKKLCEYQNSKNLQLNDINMANFLNENSNITHDKKRQLERFENSKGLIIEKSLHSLGDHQREKVEQPNQNGSRTIIAQLAKKTLISKTTKIIRRVKKVKTKILHGEQALKKTEYGMSELSFEKLKKKVIGDIKKKKKN
jgi:hypothetical protein